MALLIKYDKIEFSGCLFERNNQISILGKEDIGKIWRGNAENKKVGEEGNDTVTHGASKSEHVE